LGCKSAGERRKKEEMKLWKKYTPLIVKAIKKQLTKKGAH